MEYRDSLIVEGEQGANFSGVKCGAKTSHVFMGDKGSSIGYLRDNGSANSPLVVVVYLVCLLYTSRCV